MVKANSLTAFWDARGLLPPGLTWASPLWSPLSLYLLLHPHTESSWGEAPQASTPRSLAGFHSSHPRPAVLRVGSPASSIGITHRIRHWGGDSAASVRTSPLLPLPKDDTLPPTLPVLTWAAHALFQGCPLRPGTGSLSSEMLQDMAAAIHPFFSVLWIIFTVLNL